MALKYHNKKTVLNGIKFDSKKEAMRYRDLKLMEKAGEIENLRLQVPYVIIPKSKYGRAIKYIADFVYLKDGVEIVEDTKGVKTPVYKLKKRLLAESHDIEIKEV